MGFQLDDAQGGTRIVISEVSESSQAERMGVPVGGIIMKVAGRLATGKRRVEVEIVSLRAAEASRHRRRHANRRDGMRCHGRWHP